MDKKKSIICLPSSFSNDSIFSLIFSNFFFLSRLKKQKKIFNKTKHDLEEWRELILHLNSILKWEQKYYPGVIFGVVSFVFLMLWYLDFALLTLVSLIALLVTVVDYGYPAIHKFIFKSESWTGTHEKNYENVIQDIVDFKVNTCSSVHNFCNSRSERSTFVSTFAQFSVFPRHFLAFESSILLLNLGESLWSFLSIHGLWWCVILCIFFSFPSLNSEIFILGWVLSALICLTFELIDRD